MSSSMSSSIRCTRATVMPCQTMSMVVVHIASGTRDILVFWAVWPRLWATPYSYPLFHRGMFQLRYEAFYGAGEQLSRRKDPISNVHRWRRRNLASASPLFCGGRILATKLNVVSNITKFVLHCIVADQLHSARMYSLNIVPHAIVFVRSISSQLVKPPLCKTSSEQFTAKSP
jgi:hypothetical protein